MGISREAYRALGDIVGSDNISNEPAILDAYAYQFWAEFRHSGSKFMDRAGAVVLPGSAEEVQAIVKTCNRYGLKYKAHSTGWGVHGAPLVEDAIQLDLRRMDRILEIDEQNMFAVVEPYVIGASLQAEAMKVGLNTHLIGAGASCSPLASATSLQGMGPDSLFMGYSPENLLAAEWVMPSGEVLKTGSLGSGLGWFCGDGPGPSSRGVFRGVVGAAGGLGVFTKAAVKLYPWAGPPIMPIEGNAPVYTTRLPDVIRGHTLAWSTWQGYADAVYRIFDNDIGYITHRQFIMFGDELQAAMLKIITDPEKTMNDLEEILKKPEIQKLNEELHRSFQIVLVGMTERDIEFQEKVLDQILTETEGWKVTSMEEPTMAQWSLLYLIKLCYKNLNYVYSGGFLDGMVRGGTPDLLTSGWLEKMREQKRKFGKQEYIVDDGGDAGMGAVSTLGGGGIHGFENFIHYDPGDAESVEAARACNLDARHRPAEIIGGGLTPFYIGKGWKKAELAQIVNPAIFHYQRKIMEALDPNKVGDGSWFYLDEGDIGKSEE